VKFADGVEFGFGVHCGERGNMGNNQYQYLTDFNPDIPPPETLAAALAGDPVALGLCLDRITLPQRSTRGVRANVN
jgi:hypothetical protein